MTCRLESTEALRTCSLRTASSEVEVFLVFPIVDVGRLVWSTAEFLAAGDLKLLDALEADIVGSTRPALTLVLDIDPVKGLERAKARADGSEDRYERKGLEFHKRLRAGYLRIAEAEPKRCKVIDASGTIDDIKAQIHVAVEPLLHG